MKSLISVVFVIFASFALANHHEMDKPAFFASRTVSSNAKIETIDYQTRMVTMRGDDGIAATIMVSEDVSDLSRVVPGDEVFVELYEEVTVSVHDDDDLKLGSIERSDVSITKKDDKPAAEMINTFVTTSVVESINIEANTFQLKDVEGNITEFTARDPNNLKRSKVGDKVVIKIVQTVGVVIEKQKPE